MAANEDQESGGEAVAASLASYRQSVSMTDEGETDIQPDPAGGCPKMRGLLLVSETTGAVYPVRCGRNMCTYCLRVNARVRALAIEYGAPTRAILLTQVGEEWDQVRDRMKRLRHKLAREVKSFEWVWHVEPNPRGTGHHVHAWQRGSFVPQSVLSSLAASEGMGEFARVNAIRSVKGSSSYGLKGIGYGMKGIEAQDQGDTYLRTNGRRLTHQSRGFFVSASGESMGVKGAEKAAKRKAGGIRDEGPWVLIRSASAG